MASVLVTAPVVAGAEKNTRKAQTVARGAAGGSGSNAEMSEKFNTTWTNVVHRVSMGLTK
jgi:hypothetical protein